MDKKDYRCGCEKFEFKMWADPETMLEEDPAIFCGKDVTPEGKLANSPRNPVSVFICEDAPQSYTFDECPSYKCLFHAL